MKQCVVCLALIVLAACSNEGVPASQVPAAGSPAAGSGTPAAGSGMTTNPIGAAGTGVSGMGAAGMVVAGPAGSGPLPAGSGAAGMVAPIAGMGAAGAPAFVPGSPTFAAIYQEIIVNQGCNGGPTCHASLTGGQLKMITKDDSYAALVGVKAMGINLPVGGTNCKDVNVVRVVPMDPANSLLLKKVDSDMPPCGKRMPISGILMPNQIEQIRAWIAAGAKND